jgi:hypothetical protein
MNALTINDTFIEICKNIFNLKQLIKMELISKYHMCVVRKTNWYHFSVYLNEKQIEHVLSIYNFRNLDLSGTVIMDESVSKLINCHTLDLSHTAVTDESVPKLINCHTLYLYGTRVTNKCKKRLINNGCKIYS